MLIQQYNSTLLLYCGTRAYLFSPDKESRYIFSNRNYCCEFSCIDDASFRCFFVATSNVCLVAIKFAENFVSCSHTHKQTHIHLPKIVKSYSEYRKTSKFTKNWKSAISAIPITSSYVY